MQNQQNRTSLEARLSELEDKEAIRDLLARYSFSIDLGRVDEYLSLWTDDCVFRTDGGEGNLYTGKEEILGHVERDMMNIDGLVGRIHHLLLCNVIEVDGDLARATGIQ